MGGQVCSAATKGLSLSPQHLNMVLLFFLVSLFFCWLIKRYVRFKWEVEKKFTLEFNMPREKGAARDREETNK